MFLSLLRKKNPAENGDVFQNVVVNFFAGAHRIFCAPRPFTLVFKRSRSNGLSHFLHERVNQPEIGLFQDNYRQNAGGNFLFIHTNQYNKLISGIRRTPQIGFLGV